MKHVAITQADFAAAVVPVEREGETLIDARQLHAWLKVRTPFNNWVSRRVEEYAFAAGEDFHAILHKTGGRPRTDYLLTIDTAKELAMVERTDRGRQTRRYFIDMERAARQMAAELAALGAPEAIPPAYFDAQEDARETAGRFHSNGVKAS